MKKIFAALTVIFCIMTSALTVSCGRGEELKIYVPDGAPALAVANLIDEGRLSDYTVKVTVSNGENVKSNCLNGQADIAILPTTAAVKICADNTEYALFTVNVWGLLYVIGWDNAAELSQLQGKTVRSIGMGDTGEWLFKRILDVKGVSYEGANGVNIQYVTDGTEAIRLLMSGECDYALVGEPAATNAVNKAQSQGKTLYRVFDLQQLWQQVTQSDVTGYPQASVIVKKSLLNKTGFADALYSKLSSNEEFLTENAARLKEILQSAGSLSNAEYTADVIERCNFNAVKACEVKSALSGYLSQFNGPFAGLLKDELYYEF